MDTHRPLDESFCSIDIKIGYGESEEIISELPENHPFKSKMRRIIHYYDEPLISIVYLENENKPILEILIRSDYGKDGSHLCINHFLVFQDEDLLISTLSEYEIPTLKSYEICEKIIRIKSISSSSEARKRKHVVVTSELIKSDIPIEELPNEAVVSMGLKTPTTRKSYEYEAREGH